jgi:predicted metal-dependent enzyme (double-stranded beta helix superfamily)
MLGTTLPRSAPDPAALTATEATRSTGTAALAVSLAMRTDLWEPLVRFREDSRWTALLDGDDVAAVLDPSLRAELAGAQVWLLSWLPGQGTGLHDHGPSSGAFAVARGTLTERVVAAGRGGRPRETSTDLAPGRLRFFGPHYVHQVTNVQAAEPAVSVHVYAPRLTVMNTYRVDDTGLVRTGTERAGVDW